MVTLQELEKTHNRVEISKVTAANYSEKHDPEFFKEEDTKNFVEVPNIGDKINVRFNGPEFITHIGVQFVKGEERQYSFRVSSKDFLSNKGKDLEIFDVEDFSGNNMEIIGQGYTDGIEDKPEFAAFYIIPFTPKEVKVKTFKTDFESKIDVKGVPKEAIVIQAASSLEQEPGAENVIDGKKESVFEVSGRGKVLRLTFEDKMNVIALEYVTRLPKEKKQLIRVYNKDSNTEAPGEVTRVDFDSAYTGNYIDIILNGNTVDDQNSIESVAVYGGPFKSKKSVQAKKT